MTQKLFVDKNNIIHVTCPKCGNERDKDVSLYLNLSLDQAIQFRYNCPCGHKFSLLIERRQYIRKSVNLKGVLICNRHKYKILVLDILIMDISRYGLKIKLIDKLNIEKGQKVVIEFQLNDKLKSNVTKEAIIKNVIFPSIGVEFLSFDHYDKFGKYILFNFGDL
ncbi:MAG: hypothetical protein GY699_14560 [Desulfobacteraceae bacterium]|nr:hypothetical protein [Desulfobacteraceae bacterium]